MTYSIYSVADPDPHHFAGSGSMIFSMDPDPNPDLNMAHHPSSPPWVKTNTRICVFCQLDHFTVKITHDKHCKI